MWGWREEDRWCAFITSSAAYKATPLVSISCRVYLLYQRIVPQSSVTFPLDNTGSMYARVCALDVHQCFSLWIDPGFPASSEHHPSSFQCPFGTSPRQQTDTGYLTIIFSKILWTERKCICYPEVHNFNVKLLVFLEGFF